MRHYICVQANALRNQLKQIVDSYLNSNDGIQYANEDNEPTYDSIDMDALGITALKFIFFQIHNAEIMVCVT